MAMESKLPDVGTNIFSVMSALAAVVRPGDEVVVFEPAFDSYGLTLLCVQHPRPVGLCRYHGRSVPLSRIAGIRSAQTG